MKHVILILWLIATLIELAFATPVTLAWDASPDVERVTGYELRYGTDPDKLASVKVTGTQHTLDLPPGEYHFEVVAVAGGIESAPSDRIKHTVRPGKPKGLLVIEIHITHAP